MTDETIIEKLKIRNSDKVLDIGGSTKQHDLIEVETIVDIVPPEKAPYWPSKMKAHNYVELDICRNKLPFKDKSYDVCLCTHVLEDLYNPFLIIDEMSRVAKRGCIVTPSRGKDMEYSKLDLTDWLTGFRRQPGLSHHLWFVENKGGGLVFTPKVYPILYTSEFFVTQWLGEEEAVLFWDKSINWKLNYPLESHKIVSDYRHFVSENKDKLTFGPVLFYWDNPLNYLREITRYLLKKGNGFIYSRPIINS